MPCKYVSRLRWGLSLVASIVFVVSAEAQSTTESNAEPLPADSAQVITADSAQVDTASNSFVERIQIFDRELFRRIYAIDNLAFRSFVYISDGTSYRGFYGSVPAALVYSSVDGNGDWSDVYRLALSELTALGASLGIKTIMERDRPPHELVGVDIRSRDGDTAVDKSYSFPSGHAAVASAIVMSWSLSYPEWYVIAPGVIWASSVAVSRIWRGRHFPGDVAGGILLGALAATTVHLLDPIITPGFMKGEEDAPKPTPRLFVTIPIR